MVQGKVRVGLDERDSMHAACGAVPPSALTCDDEEEEGAGATHSPCERDHFALICVCVLLGRRDVHVRWSVHAQLPFGESGAPMMCH